jgi:hypothetical protein
MNVDAELGTAVLRSAAETEDRLVAGVKIAVERLNVRKTAALTDAGGPVETNDIGAHNRCEFYALSHGALDLLQSATARRDAPPKLYNRVRPNHSTFANVCFGARRRLKNPV